MNQLVATEVKPAVQYWFAQLELGFKGAENRTVLEHRKHHGPVRVQNAVAGKTGVCHAIIVHPPAGIAGVII